MQSCACTNTFIIFCFTKSSFNFPLVISWYKELENGRHGHANCASWPFPRCHRVSSKNVMNICLAGKLWQLYFLSLIPGAVQAPHFEPSATLHYIGSEQQCRAQILKSSTSVLIRYPASGLGTRPSFSELWCGYFLQWNRQTSVSATCEAPLQYACGGCYQSGSERLQVQEIESRSWSFSHRGLGCQYVKSNVPSMMGVDYSNTASL